MGNLAREKFDGKTANVLRGAVSMANNGGFIQMATNLAPGSSELASTPVDASPFEGFELERHGAQAGIRRARHIRASGGAR